MASFSLTQQLLDHDRRAYERATQSPFLAAAARGQVSRNALGRWLANDRMYIHNYIRGAGRMLASHRLPVTAHHRKDPVFAVVDWLIEALANVRREEHFFIESARNYGITIDLPTDADGEVLDEGKLEGLRRFERLFAGIEPCQGAVLPWLEDAIVFWATEKCYLDAWSWAKSKQEGGDGASDADGGALRDEFIPNWSSPGFATFVDKLSAIIDDAVRKVVKESGDAAASDLMARATKKWNEVLDAESLFWPAV